MSGAFGFSVDKNSLWRGPPRSREAAAPDHLVINPPTRRGDTSHYTTQPRLALEPEHRGFGLKTGIMKAPENLIDDFNREAQTIQSNLVALAPRRQEDRRMNEALSPTLTLTKVGVDLGDLSFGGTFDDDAATSPIPLQHSLSRADLGIPSSQPLSRNASQTSSRPQDDAVSLAFSTTSAGDEFAFPLGISLYTPGTSFSQGHSYTNPVMSFPGNSPTTTGFYHGSQGRKLSTSPQMDPSFDGDWSFPVMGGDFSDTSNHRPTPQRPPRQSALSQRLADSPAPMTADADLMADPYYETMAFGEEALSANFVRLDSQEARAGLIPYPLDRGYSHISVTPADPLDPLDMIDPLAVDDVEGTSPGRFHPYDCVSFSHVMPHSFPKPRVQVQDDRLAVPDLSYGAGDHRRPPRRPRALSNSASRPSSVASNHRSSVSTKPIPIPSQSRHARLPMPRSLPPSLPHGSRGRRKGPMEATARQLARKTRNEKTVCIRCRASKQKCHRPMDQLDGRCTNCEKVANTHKPTGPCTKAYFEDLVLPGNLDGNYALVMTHPTSNGQRRLQRRLPSDFSLDYFLTQLDVYRSRFNLKVCYDGDKHFYGLNLDKYFHYMSKVKDGLQSKMSATDFVGFLDRDLAHADSKTEDWTKMLMYTPDLRDNIIEFYLKTAIMSEHASLLFVSRDAEVSQERLINPDDPIEANILDLAAQLVRIVARKVEVCAFLQLQKELHDVLLNPWQQQQKSKSVPFLHRIGRVLVTLRSRAARAAASAQAASTAPEDPRPSNESRTTELCRVLWSYYYVFRNKMAAPLGEPWETFLKGVWMPSAPSGGATATGLSPTFRFSPPLPPFQSPQLGTEPGEVWHAFPPAKGDGTTGFEAWMADAPEGYASMLMS